MARLPYAWYSGRRAGTESEAEPAKMTTVIGLD
jgi:hypothetical protein